MATIFKGPGGSVEMNPTNLPREIKRIVSAVVMGTKKASKQSLRDIKQSIQSGIRDNSLQLNPLKDSTLVARKFGKDTGATPSKPKKYGDKPLLYTGQTVKGIRVEINGDSYSLGFDDSATITYSNSNMGYVAYKQEYGFTITGTYTKKMLAYLHVMFSKQKVRRKKLGLTGSYGARVGMSFTRRVDPRPAWGNATERVFPTIEMNYKTAIIDALQKRGLLVTE